MLVPFLIMLREGIEAALIVGIVASYLAQTGRRRWLPAVGAGIMLAVVICLGLGIALQAVDAEFPQRQQEMFEAAVALVAVGMLTSMVLWMRRLGRSIKAGLRDSVDAALRTGGSGWPLVLMVFLAVGREGLESVFFLLAIFGQDLGAAPAIGALAGLAAACCVGFAIYWGGVRIDLRRFFQWTGVLIIFVAAGLLAGAVRALHEAGLWNGLQSIVYDASASLPLSSAPGTVLSALLGYQEAPTLGEVLVYVLFLIPVLVLFLSGAGLARPLSRGVPLAVLLLAVGVQRAAAQNAPPVVNVTVTSKGCEPASLTVPPGKSIFRIRNASAQALEWEILDGVMVVDERENIIPGLTQSLTTTLQPGEYQITCGLLSNPRGRLVVEAAAHATAPAPKPDLAPTIATYKTYVQDEIAALVTSTRLLTEAVKAGRLDAAQAAYAPAHLHYERIEPIAELFNDLDGSMDSRADDFEKKAADTGFVGFHRLEKALFADRTTDGMAPVADRLMADTLDLQQRVATLAIPSKAMVGGAANLIEEVASKKISGEEDRYSRTDLWDFQANIDGANAIYTLLQTQVRAADPALDRRIQNNLARVDGLLTKYRTADGGFEGYDKLSEADRRALKGPITALAEDFSKLRGTLGID